MNYIVSLTDKDIFPTKEITPVSEWNPRKTVKVIIQNKEGKIAMVTNPITTSFFYREEGWMARKIYLLRLTGKVEKRHFAQL